MTQGVEPWWKVQNMRVEVLCKLGGYGDTGNVIVQDNDVTVMMVTEKEGMVKSFQSML